MSVFRPLNSEESNLFTIRLIIDSHSSGSSYTLVDEGDDTETYLLNPTVNNLPTNFSVKWDNGNSNYEIEDFDYQVPMETLFGYACLSGTITDDQPSYIIPNQERVNYWINNID